jgi:hypothetical protein
MILPRPNRAHQGTGQSSAPSALRLRLVTAIVACASVLASRRDLPDRRYRALFSGTDRVPATQ